MEHPRRTKLVGTYYYPNPNPNIEEKKEIREEREGVIKAEAMSRGSKVRTNLQSRPMKALVEEVVTGEGVTKEAKIGAKD